MRTKPRQKLARRSDGQREHHGEVCGEPSPVVHRVDSQRRDHDKFGVEKRGDTGKQHAVLRQNGRRRSVAHRANHGGEREHGVPATREWE